MAIGTLLNGTKRNSISFKVSIGSVYQDFKKSLKQKQKLNDTVNEITFRCTLKKQQYI